MFAAACARAKEFTFPIIISFRHAGGECRAGIGSVVIINDEGWFVTAYHIINQIESLAKSKKEYIEVMDKRKIIENDNSINSSVRKGRLNKLPISQSFITNYSILIGTTGFKLGEMHVIPEIDLAIGKLKDFDKGKIKLYPEFKDYTKPMTPGTSLCKLGFPFHNIKPTFNEQANSFELPVGAIPIPLFPLDGIYTRQIFVQANHSKAFPLKYIETSSPGLRGQSGGPTYDIHGAIWAIQSKTQHLPLGFGDGDNKTLTAKEKEHIQHQYLNVGWGIHAETICCFLKEKGVSYVTSAN